MSTTSTGFQDLIERVRTGDEAAAAELVNSYGSEIRLMARVRLTDPTLRRQLDSMDIAQSVLGRFFVRAACGEFDLETPDSLIRLLATMVRNSCYTHARRHTAIRRDMRRVASKDVGEMPLSDQAPSPSEHVSLKELLGAVEQSMSEQERKLVELRRDGHSWEEVATETGLTAESARKRLSRAFDRISEELNIE